MKKTHPNQSPETLISKRSKQHLAVCGLSLHIGSYPSFKKFGILLIPTVFTKVFHSNNSLLFLRYHVPANIVAPFDLHLKHTHTIHNSSFALTKSKTLETSVLENLNGSRHGTKHAETFSKARYSQILLTFFNWSFSGTLEYSGDLYVAIRWGRITYFTQRGWITDYREAVLVNHVSDITTLLCTASIHTHMHVTEANNRDN